MLCKVKYGKILQVNVFYHLSLWMNSKCRSSYSFRCKWCILYDYCNVDICYSFLIMKKILERKITLCSYILFHDSCCCPAVSVCDDVFALVHMDTQYWLVRFRWSRYLQYLSKHIQYDHIFSVHHRVLLWNIFVYHTLY
jgi:hypothetical protein